MIKRAEFNIHTAQMSLQLQQYEKYYMPSLFPVIGLLRSLMEIIFKSYPLYKQRVTLYQTYC